MIKIVFFLIAISNFSAALTFTISNGNLVSGCPSKTFYDQGKDQCCRYVKAANDEGKNGTSGNCVDLAAPGRASDCPQNKDRCDDPLWRDLMTEQCPKTCGRCGKKAKSDSKRGDSIGNFFIFWPFLSLAFFPECHQLNSLLLLKHAEMVSGQME